MNKIKIISILALGVLAMSCGNVKGGITLGGGGGSTGTGSGGSSPTNANRAWQDQPSQCGTTASNNSSTPMGLWSLSQVSRGGYAQQMTLSIQDTSTTLTVSCYSPNQTYSRTATVTVLSHFQGSNYIIDQSQTKTVGDKNLMCAISLQAGQVLYRFSGSCIQMKLNGAPHTFTHVDQ